MSERPNEAHIRLMENSPEAIVDFAAQRAREVWAEKKEPYLLALLSPELKARDVDYRAVLGEVRLKEFFQAHGADKIKLIYHPTQRSKIGLIPYDENYTYAEKGREADAASDRISAPTLNFAPVRSLKSHHVVNNFLQLLATLPNDEIEKVHIPVSVIAMLLRAR